MRISSLGPDRWIVFFSGAPSRRYIYLPSTACVFLPFWHLVASLVGLVKTKHNCDNDLDGRCKEKGKRCADVVIGRCSNEAAKAECDEKGQSTIPAPVVRDGCKKASIYQEVNIGCRGLRGRYFGH